MNYDKQEAISIAQKTLDGFVSLKLSKGKGDTGGDSGRYGAVCLVNDKLVVNSNKHPCHYFMSTYKNPVLVLNQYGCREGLNRDAYEGYLSWLISDESPWREFNNKNKTLHPSGILDAGWIWDNLSYPSNLQHSFLVASRMAAEWPYMIEKWHQWVSQGIHPSLAFVFLDVFKPVDNERSYTSDKRKKNPVYKVNHTNRYDWPLDVCTAGEDYVLNFIHGRVEKLTKAYSEVQQYRPVNRIFGNNALACSDDKAYPNVVYSRYFKEDYTKKYWSGRDTGFMGYDTKNLWVLEEPELLEIMKQEEKRLLGNENKVLLVA